MINFALTLTYVRLIGSITLLPFLLLSQHKYIAAIFFIFLAVTDFFDGYVARNYKMETKAGKILDPIADKFLITATLLCLISTNQCPLIFAIPLVMREIAIMAMRQYTAEHNVILSVSRQGKLKTTLQCISLCVAIVTPPPFKYLIYIRNILLGVTTFFSLQSLFNYFLEMNKKIKE